MVAFTWLFSHSQACRIFHLQASVGLPAECACSLLSSCLLPLTRSSEQKETGGKQELEECKVCRNGMHAVFNGLICQQAFEAARNKQGWREKGCLRKQV